MRILISIFLSLASLSATGKPTQSCDALLERSVPDTLIESAGLVTDHAELASFCQVEGRIATRVSFVMRMPEQGWNGKFVVAGCGGFCGYLSPDKPGYSNSMNEALKSGYAAIQSDGGHQAPNWDTDWAIGDETALKLYAGEWMPLAASAGRHLVEGFYGDGPRRSYFSGCSNGGRLGLYAAQRYPDLFDGIAAGGAIFDLTGNSGVHGLWLLQSTRDRDGKAVIDQEKMPILHRHVLERCDTLDGVEDSVVARTELCKPDVAALQCQTGADTEECFTGAEVKAIERLYLGATVDGTQLFPGIPPGSEFLWSQWIVGTDEKRGWGESAAEGNLRLTYGIPRSEPFNPHDYVLADELENLQKYADVLNATDPDLSGLEKSGHKLFYYHGLADPLILEGRARQYYEDAAAGMGVERLAGSARFMMVPGHGHCWEKPGQVADDFDPLAVIDRWVESGEAPDEVIAKLKTDDPAKAQSRKLCPYPQVAVFKGGDSDRAESFVCE